MPAYFSPHARAILWAQFRSLRNRLPRSNWLAVVFTGVIGFIWYGIFAIIAVAVGILMSKRTEMETIRQVLPGGLLLVFLYWVVVPILLASKGSSLELRKLMVYPIRGAEFFRIEILLRLSVGAEPLIVTLGAMVGLLFNPAIPHWAPFALLLFVVFTTCTALGVHDLLGRLLARKGIREVVALLFIIVVMLPQFALIRGNEVRLRQVAGAASWRFLPWSAAAHIAEGRADVATILVLLAWAAAAYIFGRRQFEHTLRFDTAEGGPARSNLKASRLEWFYRIPNAIFRDPTGALVEKELRCLVRMPRFRLVFAMGFSFGLIVWWPLAFGRHPHSFMADNFVMVVSVYAILLLSEVLLWNCFGFDRSAAQLYFVAPVQTRTVLRAKNIAAAFFVLLEATIACLVCVLVRLPLTPMRVLEAYSVTMVATLLLVSIGNITSLYSPRAVDPTRSFRAARVGRVQAILLVSYPVIAIPLVLAYLARYAFQSEAALFGVLALAAAFGIIVYKISMDSAVAMAVSKREAILTALSRGDNPVGG